MLMFRLSIAATIVFGFLALNMRASEEWSPEKKEACTALLIEYPSAIEPKFKNDYIKQHWHRLLLTDEAIHFSRVSSSKYHDEISMCLYRKIPFLYQSDAPIKTDDVWRIEIIEPHPMSSDSTSLVTFISVSSKKIVAAWETPAG